MVMDAGDTGWLMVGLVLAENPSRSLADSIGSDVAK
jgi:hypothetical protein